MRNKQIIALLLGFVLMSAGCSYANTGPDEYACAYGGGPFEAQTRKGEYAPGSGRDFVGVADSVITLPANVRNYIVDKDPGTGDVPNVDFIEAPSGDGVELQYEVNVRFRINTDLGCKLWEEHGKRFDIDTDEGWSEFLEANLRPILENKMKEQSQSYDWENIWRNSITDNGSTWTRMQDDMGQAITNEINRSLGESYLCGVTWTPGSDDCTAFEVLIKSAVPTKDSLTDKYADIQAREAELEAQRVDKQREREAIELDAENQLIEAEAQVAIEEQNLEAQRLRAEADAELCRVLAAEGVDCTLLAAAENGSIDFWIIPEGSDAPTIIKQD